MKIGLIIWAALLIAFTLLGGRAMAETRDIEIKLFQFQPKTVEVPIGATVEWINDDAIEHSVTAGKPGKPTDDFDSGFFTKGQSFAHVFAKPGTYEYFCKRHQNMKAMIVVTE